MAHQSDSTNTSPKATSKRVVFAKENLYHLSILSKWCEAHNVQFCGKEISVILSAIDEILSQQ